MVGSSRTPKTHHNNTGSNGSRLYHLHFHLRLGELSAFERVISACMRSRPRYTSSLLPICSFIVYVIVSEASLAQCLGVACLGKMAVCILRGPRSRDIYLVKRGYISTLSLLAFYSFNLFFVTSLINRAITAQTNVYSGAQNISGKLPLWHYQVSYQTP